MEPQVQDSTLGGEVVSTRGNLLQLYFKSDSVCSQLVRTVFRSGDGSELTADRGPQFKWSAGVRGLVILQLQTLAWSLRGAEGDVPVIRGYHKSLAYSLDNATNRKDDWLSRIFGSAKDGKSKFAYYIRRFNSSFTTNPDGPVEIRMKNKKNDKVHPFTTEIYVDGAQLSDAASIADLAEAIARASEDPKKVIYVIHIDRPFTDFTDDDLKELIERMQQKTGGEIRVIRKERGSVRLILELDEDQADRLVDAVEAGEFADLNVLSARYIDHDPSYESAKGGADSPVAELTSPSTDLMLVRTSVPAVPTTGTGLLGRLDQIYRTGLAGFGQASLPLKAAVVIAGMSLAGFTSWGAILITPGVYRFTTNQGEVIIRTDDPDVRVVIMQGGEQVEIIDSRTGHRVNLKAGRYEVVLKGAKGGLKLSTNAFTLTRGSKEIVEVRQAAPAHPAPSVEKEAKEPDGRGRALDNKGDVDREIEALRRADQLRPPDPDTLDALGRALLKRKQAGDLDGAIEAFRRASGLRPDANTLDALGGALLERKQAGDLDGAIEAFRRASELRPDANTLDALGRALLKRKQAGDLDGAIEAFRRASGLRSNDNNILEGLVRALRLKGGANREIEALRRAHPGLR